MSTKILVNPAEDYFVAFLSTRGINLSNENPDVVHYFGDSQRKLKKLVSEHDPDLVVICNKKVFSKDYKFPFVLDPIKCDKDIYTAKTVVTNASELAKLYYRSLGLERIIDDCTKEKKDKEREKLKISLSTVKKIFAVMMWD